MAESFTLNFIDGKASALLPIGSYSYISNTIRGYKNGTVDGFKINANTKTVDLTITADGVLNVSVKDSEGTPIANGKLRITDGAGTDYGKEITITQGAASFSNLPYDADSPIIYYVEQNGSDPTHFPVTTPQQVTADRTPEQLDILNERGRTVDVTLTDNNYPGITPLTGDVVFER